MPYRTMNDAACVQFLQWALPRLGMRWRGFCKVRRQVCKRVGRRLRELELPDLDAYRDYLALHPDEWQHLDSFCRITISRFHRDRGVFDLLRTQLLPELARHARAAGKNQLSCWCAGCASGEEVYTLRIIWELEIKAEDLRFLVLGTDSHAGMLARAREASYRDSSLKELPSKWIQPAFERAGASLRLREAFRKDVDFKQQDIRREIPRGDFDLVLCRNLVFTYFDDDVQRKTLEGIARSLRPEGFLVVGSHESLPPETAGFQPVVASGCVFRKTGV